jgi:hypothetical protein
MTWIDNDICDYAGGAAIFVKEQNMLSQSLIIIGALIGAAGAFAYLWDTVRGKVKPNRVSFLLWSVAPMIAFAAQVKQGVGLESLMTFTSGFLPFLTFTASFANKRAEWRLTRFDASCGVLSVAGLILWLITKVGNVAIVFSIVADALAAIPTLIKAYKYPETELAWPWMATCVGIVLTLLTLKEWTFANSGFIIYIFIVDLIIYICVQLKPGKRGKALDSGR